eukprot:GHRQ01035033.1.p2 GENE.GHRQ01035033.1~~GHRQ01035033.1.p2  ORF type:complete len:248 (-),score=67.41 GHRQ01035033.1:362-1075(-)
MPSSCSNIHTAPVPASQCTPSTEGAVQCTFVCWHQARCVHSWWGCYHCVLVAHALQGNVGLAIFLTVASNVVGVIFVPLWLKVMLSAGTSGIQDLHINIAIIFVKLLLSNLVPTVLGKLLRDCVKPVGAWVTRNRTLLSIINNTSLAFIIWQTLSSAREYIVNSTFGTMLLVFVSALLIHIIYLVFNACVVKLLRVPTPEAVSTIIMASQKSAPVAVTAISYITTDPVAQRCWLCRR